MYKWVVNGNIRMMKLINSKLEGTPTILPNNLKNIKKAYGYTEKDLAQILGVSNNNVNAVLNERVAISGVKIIALMEKLNIPFVSMFSKDKKCSAELEKKDDFMYILETEGKIENNDDSKPYIEEFISQISKDYNDDTTMDILAINKLKYRKKFYLDLPAKIERFLGVELTEKFKSSVDEIESSSFYKRKKSYYFIAIRVKSNVIGEIDLNALNKIDVEFSNKFFKIPFRKVEQIKLEESQYSIENNMVKINSDKIYNIITTDGIVEGNIIKKEFVTLQKDNNITINILTDIPHINKFKLYRVMKGLTTVEMANKLGITNETYSLIERGCQKMSLKIMWRVEHEVGIFLHNILDVSAYYEKLCKKQTNN